MTNRPKSVAVVGWIIIILSVISIISIITFRMIGVHDGGQSITHPSAAILKNSFYVSLLILIAIGNFIAGISILGGRNWARWLYVDLFILSLIINIALNGLSTFTIQGFIPGIVIFIIFAFVLFRAKDFFAKDKSTNRMTDSSQ